MADGLLSASQSFHSKNREALDTDTESCAVYHRRWYILAVFSLIAGVQAAAWNTWGPITGSAEDVFGWSDGTIALLENWGPIAYIISFLLFSWLMDVKGLRISVLITVALMFLGTGLRCITFRPEPATWLIHVGQFLNDLAAPVAMGGPPLVSSTWFPPHQRATATAISSLMSYVGISVSFGIGPFVLNPSEVADPPNSTEESLVEVKNVSNKLPKEIPWNEAIARARHHIMVYMYVGEHSCICHYFFLCSLFLNDRNCQFWNLNILYGATTGVFSGWGGVLAVNLLSFNLKQDTAGWIGFYANIAGCIFGFIMARFADVFTGRMKLFLVFLFFGSTASFLWFSLLCQGIIPFSKVWLYISAVLGGCFINGSIPLFYELTIETTYPIAEGIPMAVITTSNHVACLLFLAALMIPGIGTMWMNWCMVGICGGCIPLLLLFRERYTRLELDAVNRQARGSRKQINADHESTPLILSQERQKNGDDVSLPNGTHFSSTEV
ncbi:PREDICTED: disrupted in renal carcinoma protein 2-like [Acropora digitifera]|uniref:disrupted in renal carcinoma protein 2-like n=1 Tax=Acropora digitifera TaxID=70779 RepID=UPI00077ACC4C|nr:PREDICTED: disrupted in renal carcinoma protein 2-like [Acropora digitifera]